MAITINTIQVFSLKASSLSFCRDRPHKARGCIFLRVWPSGKKMQLPDGTISLTCGGRGVDAREDQEDVERVLAGDISAFERIVQRWQKPLVNLAVPVLPGPQPRAKDMAQEAFLRAFRGLKGWRRDAAFSSWLFAIATNFYRSEVRRIPEGMVPLDSIEGRAALNAGLIELNDEDRDRAVRRAVSALPGKYKDVLVLFYFHEMDVSASSAQSGLARG
jgi:RNA polymerase sigma-70 factor (ECF subfamily)